MKNILGWSSFLLESISLVADEVGDLTATQTTTTTTLDPNIEYSIDRQGNPVEFNKKTREEITYHPSKKGSKGEKIILKRGKFDKQNKKDGTWRTYDLDKQIDYLDNYDSDKLYGQSIENYKNANENFPKVKVKTIWDHGKRIEQEIDYLNGDKEVRKFKEGREDSYKFTKRDIDDNLLIQGAYYNGVEEDVWRWYKKGEFECSMSYTSGKPDGWGKNPDNETIRGREPEEK